MKRPTIQTLTLVFFAAGLGAKAVSEDPVSFWKKEVKPLLENNCWKCHGADKVRAELVLTTRSGVIDGGEIGPAVDLENPANSLILKMVSYKDQELLLMGN